ncbi:MAG TPA: serine/threonine-protein kinase [Nevskiaceae bacterium]|nr:serine/threonine-protein kinase [Nevskiaceae bacterium]
MEKKLWSRDWLAALAFSLVFGLVVTLFSGSMQSMERAVYDLGVRGNDKPPSDRIAVIKIDDESIANIGTWPWPRTLHAQLIDKLHEAGAKAIGYEVFFSEAAPDAGGTALARISEQLEKSPLVRQVPGEIDALEQQLHDNAARPPVTGIYKTWHDSVLGSRYRQELDVLRAQLKEASGDTSADKAIVGAIKKAGNVYLPMSFALQPAEPGSEQPVPDFLKASAMTHVVDRVHAGATPIEASAPQLPIAAVGAVAAGIGHLAQLLDGVDGYVRADALVLKYGDALYPSLALRLASAELEMPIDDVSVRLGEGVALGGVDVKTDAQEIFLSNFYQDQAGKPAFQTDSFYDVIAGKIRPDKYKNKIVIVGPTARGVAQAFPTPVSALMPPPVLLANLTSSLLQGDYYSRPAWGTYARLGLCVLVALYLAFALPSLSPLLGAIISAVLLIGFLVGEFVLMVKSQMSIPLATPALLLVTGHGFMMLKRLRLTERLKVTSETESAESNRMLGLAFQTQGQLDMAFDKFKRVQPPDEKVLDALYNLGQDFERKRQFNKAESVYAYIVEHQADFRDAGQKQARAKKLSETVMLGGTSSGANSSLLLAAEAGGEKAKLGRYEIEKELGKGAMGVVYLGKDPRIGRMVAIKTMALSNEFEADELKTVKERFFREAESAGRLQHPNIVAIYDAGEEHDLAYIAMELLKGNDLTKFCKAESLLPVHLVVKFIAQAADALDYAHSNGVVHRDIKPANMMLIPDKGIIKLTDFGIARISDASRTRTGLVLGSPSYMSPEQLRGQKVDGRSDLFSLGATLFQLLTGQLPFQAESLATLMMKIVTEKHPDVTKLRQGVPPQVVAVLDKALAKDREQRYQRGSEMARDLRMPPKPAAAPAPAVA